MPLFDWNEGQFFCVIHSLVKKQFSKSYQFLVYLEISRNGSLETSAKDDSIHIIKFKSLYLRYLASPGISFVIFERDTGLGEVGVELLVVNNG